MKTVVYPLISVLSVIALAYRLGDLRRDPNNLALRYLCVAFAMLSTIGPLSFAAVVEPLERATGVVLVWTAIPVTIALASFQMMVLLWNYPLEEARGWRIPVRLVVNGLAATLIVAFCLTAEVDVADVARARAEGNEAMALVATPWVAEAKLISLCQFAFTVVDVGYHTLRYRRLVDRAWLRRGLALVTMSSVPNMISCLSSSVYAVAVRYFDANLEWVQRTAYISLGVAVTAGLAGWTLPAWGPRLDRIRAYRILGPLWSALSRANPEVVFQAPRLDRGRWWRAGLEFRLYRRIIEIRDSRLALRAYLDDDVAEAARRRCEAAGLEGDDLRATVEAAVLTAAVRAKAAGSPALRRSRTDNASGDMDLAQELIWLTRVAAAFTASPVVADVTAPAPAAPAES